MDRLWTLFHAAFDVKLDSEYSIAHSGNIPLWDFTAVQRRVLQDFRLCKLVQEEFVYITIPGPELGLTIDRWSARAQSCHMLQTIGYRSWFHGKTLPAGSEVRREDHICGVRSGITPQIIRFIR